MIVRLIALVLLAQAGAAPVQPPKSPLFAAHRLSCSFGLYAAAIWKDTTPQVVSRTQNLAFQIDSIDTKKNTARIVNGGAAALVSMIVTPTGINLVEKTQIGNLNVTTIFAAGGQGNVFLAVHSRHIGDLTTALSVSQNYGTCEIPQ